MAACTRGGQGRKKRSAGSGGVVRTRVVSMLMEKFLAWETAEIRVEGVGV